MPLVTIGLPVYNSEQYLRYSLESLLSQTYTEFELIISDNASTDSTGDICRTYAAADSRIRYTRNSVNIGNPRNFNRIVGLTTTRYLKWSTSDDLWAPTFLERAVEAMERDPGLILCYPKTFIIDAEGGNPQPYEDDLDLPQDDPAERFLALLARIRLAHQHLGLIRTELLRRTHLLGAYSGSDITLLAEMTLYGRFKELPERLFFRRYHEKSGSWKRADPNHEARFYHGVNRRKTGAPKWRGSLGRLSAVNSSPLPLRSRLRLSRRLLRDMVRSRDELLGELIGSLHPER